MTNDPSLIREFLQSEGDKKLRCHEKIRENLWENATLVFGDEYNRLGADLWERMENALIEQKTNDDLNDILTIGLDECRRRSLEGSIRI